MRLEKFHSRKKTKKLSGYSLIEVLVASGILLIGISAAASFSLTMTTQEELNHRMARGLNHLECYSRLYQLGLDQAAIEAIIPPEFARAAAPTMVPVLPAEGNLEGQTIILTLNSVENEGSWSSGAWTGGSQTTIPTRQFSVRAFRNTIR